MKASFLLFIMFSGSLAAGAAEVPSSPISRKDFKAAVLGKTLQEVLKSEAKPDITDGDESAGMWIYHHKTLDPITEKVDQSSIIYYDKGKVIDTNFISF